MFKKKHTWDILATLFQDSVREPALRIMILQVSGTGPEIEASPLT